MRACDSYHCLLQKQAEENGVADLSKDLEHFSPEFAILDHGGKLGVVEAKDTWRGRRGG